MKITFFISSHLRLVLKEFSGGPKGGTLGTQGSYLRDLRAGWLAGQLASWPACQLAGQLASQLASQLACQLAGQLPSQLADLEDQVWFLANVFVVFPTVF